MASEKNITMRQYNGVDYDTLYPKTKVEQVVGMDGYFTKDQTLSSAIANLYGLSDNDAIPNNIFNQLYYSINGTDSKLYQWNRWKWSIDKTSLVSSTYRIDLEGKLTYSAYSSNVNITRDGTCKMVNPTNYTFARMEKPSTNAIGINCYAKLSGSSSITNYNNPEFFFSTNASWDFIDASPNNYLDNFKNIYSVKTVKTSEVVTSTNPNAYTVSDEPDAEGWYYEKLPDIQMYPPLSRFISSSYIGTGTSGSSNQNTIILPFNPKMVIISQSDGVCLGTLINPSTVAQSFSAAGPTGTGSLYELTVAWGDKQVSWYGSSVAKQLNTSGVTYNYIALGNL